MDVSAVGPIPAGVLCLFMFLFNENGLFQTLSPSSQTTNIRQASGFLEPSPRCKERVDILIRGQNLWCFGKTVGRTSSFKMIHACLPWRLKYKFRNILRPQSFRSKILSKQSVLKEMILHRQPWKLVAKLLMSFCSSDSCSKQRKKCVGHWNPTSLERMGRNTKSRAVVFWRFKFS